MRVLIWSAIVVGLSFLPLQASGEFITGNALYEDCQKGEGADSMSWGLCTGFLEGVSDALSSGTTIAGNRACVPQSVTVGQMKDVAIKWLGDHPAVRHYTAVSLVAAALAEAFPCQ